MMYKGNQSVGGYKKKNPCSLDTQDVFGWCMENRKKRNAALKIKAKYLSRKWIILATAG